MKTKTKRNLAILAVTAGVAVAGLALAKEGERGRFGHGGPRAEMMFNEIDADGDGKVTLEEFRAHREARFNEADANGDGNISREEMIAALVAMQSARIQERAEMMTERMFSRFDANEDGILGADEIPENRGEKMFARLDADEDGSITLEEMRAMRHGPGRRSGDHSGQ
ncbi:MAG: EF-hand domain-containing protein [Paracoccaceae bacterium]